MVQKRSFITVSMILGIISSALIVIGMALPVLDISCFYEKADFQYNLFKVCKNIGLISSMWKAIPIGFIIAAVMMLVLSFVRIPIFKILPCMLAIAMIVIMLADVSHVVDWIKGFLEKYTNLSNGEVSVDFAGVMKSLMIGVYVIVVGIGVGLISCFIQPRDNDNVDEYYQDEVNNYNNTNYINTFSNANNLNNYINVNDVNNYSNANNISNYSNMNNDSYMN